MAHVLRFTLRFLKRRPSDQGDFNGRFARDPIVRINWQAASRGRLRLSAPLTFGILELTPALNAFAVAYPEIELDMSFSDRVVDLLDEGLDMALRVDRPNDSNLTMPRY